MIVNPKNPIVKYAILEAHKFFCFYTGNKLTLLNCTIDHVIPESYKNKPDILSKYVENYNGEFNVNNIDNLVPATFNANFSKGDKQYDLNTILHYLEQTKSKAPKILKRIEELKKYKNIEKMLATISNYISTSDDPKEEISKVIDFLANNRAPFEERRQILDTHFVRSLPTVSIDAYLPSSFKDPGCCLLLFRSLFVSDCMITLNHAQIIQQLFSGLYTESKFEKRGFILHEDLYSPNIYHVQIGNNRFALMKNEVQELCEIIDDFSIVYLERYKFLEKRYGTIEFKEINAANFSIKMFEIKRSLWKQLIQFTLEFDYSKGNTEWHIFNATNGTIVVYPEDEILSQFYPAQSESLFYKSYMHSDDNVLIFWKPSSSFYNKEDKVWDCKKAYFWLTQKFIPYVIYYYNIFNKDRSWFIKGCTYEQFIKQFDINKYINSSNLKPIEKEIDEVSQISELKVAIDRMQYFFTCSKNIHVSQTEIKATYEALALLILYTTLPEYSYSYIGGKLSCRNRTQDEIYKFLKIKINNKNQNDYNQDTIDMACRCMLEVIKNTPKNSELMINKAILNELKNLLVPIWNKYSLESYIQKINNK